MITALLTRPWSTPAKVAGGVAVAIAALGAIVVWFAWRDAKLVRRHDAQQAGEQAQQELVAERNANSRAADRQILTRKHEEELSNAQVRAETLDPHGSGVAVGPATSAVLDELRRQRATRTGG